MSAPRPNLNPSPKSRFQESGDNISKHRVLVEDTAFNRAVHYGKLEYFAWLGQEVTNNPQLASVAGFKMCGVHEFLDFMLKLSEQAPPPRPPAPVNLDHKA